MKMVKGPVNFQGKFISLSVKKSVTLALFSLFGLFCLRRGRSPPSRPSGMCTHCLWKGLDVPPQYPAPSLVAGEPESTPQVLLLFLVPMLHELTS